MFSSHALLTAPVFRDDRGRILCFGTLDDSSIDDIHFGLIMKLRLLALARLGRYDNYNRTGVFLSVSKARGNFGS